MRSKLMAVTSLLILSAGIVFAQQRDANYYPFKDLVFAQIAVGGGYETLITATNRGSQSYLGTLFFYKGKGEAWNPTVNATKVSGGQLPLAINAGSTVSFVMTGTDGVEAGFAIFKATNLEQTNFLEGNLTYFVKSGGQIVDAIGVLPSTQVIGTCIPFEDFSTIALAFANTDPEGNNASVKLSLYSENNVQVSTTKILPLGRLEHRPIYLWQIFEGVQLKRGRVEIQSDVSISATALTQAQGGQFSAIPMGSTSATYSVFTQGAGILMLRMTLWTNGVYANGYMMASQAGGTPQMFLVSGQTLGGIFRLHFYGKNEATQNYELFGYITTDVPVSVGTPTIRGTYYVGIYSEDTVQTGTYTATLIQ